MKLDLLVASLKGGGAERVAVNLADAWVRTGHTVRLIVTDPDPGSDYMPDPAVELLWLSSGKSAASSPPLRLLQRLGRIRRALTDGSRADVVIAIQANLAIETALAVLGNDLRVIGCEHNTPARAVRGRLWQALRPLAYRRLAAVVALTEGAAAQLRGICGATPLRVIPNALQLPLAEAAPRLDPDDLLPPDAPLLLAVGRLVPAKGFDNLLSRFNRILALSPKTRLVILGDGPLRPELAAQIEALGLKGKALMPGRAGNMADWYRRAQLFVMTSRWEGMPMVLLEAMGHGLVPVVTDFEHGPRDVIRPGIDGEIMAPLDEAFWVSQIANLLADSSRRSAMGQRATEVAKRFGEDEVMRAWGTLLAEVTAEHSS